jgi:hypothetical protein
MMRISWTDGAATILVLAAVGLYGGGVGAATPFGLSDRGFAAVLFGLGIAACTSARSQLADVYGAGPGPRAPLTYVVLATGVGVVALVAGIIAVIGGGSVAATTLVAAIVVMWMLASARHLGWIKEPQTARRADEAASSTPAAETPGRDPVR